MMKLRKALSAVSIFLKFLIKIFLRIGYFLCNEKHTLVIKSWDMLMR